jgi:hypothetical protein
MANRHAVEPTDRLTTFGGCPCVVYRSSHVLTLTLPPLLSLPLRSSRNLSSSPSPPHPTPGDERAEQSRAKQSRERSRTGNGGRVLLRRGPARGAEWAAPGGGGGDGGEALTEAIAELLLLIRLLSSDRGTAALADVFAFGGSPDAVHRLGGPASRSCCSSS